MRSPAMPEQTETVIVTSASQGIGASVVKSFLERGYCVVANSRNITESGAFEPSNKLALVDGNIGQSATAQRIVELQRANLGQSTRSSITLASSSSSLSRTIPPRTSGISLQPTWKVSSISPSSRSNRCWLRNQVEASSVSRPRWHSIRSPE